MNNKYSLNSLELFKDRIKKIFNNNNSYIVKENKNNFNVDRYILVKKNGNKAVHIIAIYLNENETDNTILLKYYTIENGRYEVERKLSKKVFNDIKKYLDERIPKNKKKK